LVVNFTLRAGISTNNTTNTLFVYDALSDSWTRRPACHKRAPAALAVDASPGLRVVVFESANPEF
jgi:hypothetical protein